MAKFIRANLISIHAPVKGATTIKRRKNNGINNFNPRTREGCDNERVKIFLHDN